MKTYLVIAAMVIAAPAFAAPQELDQGGAVSREQLMQQGQKPLLEPGYDKGEQVESGELQPNTGVIIDDDQTAELPPDSGTSVTPGLDSQSSPQNQSIEDEEYGSPIDDEHAPAQPQNPIR